MATCGTRALISHLRADAHVTRGPIKAQVAAATIIHSTSIGTSLPVRRDSLNLHEPFYVTAHGDSVFTGVLVHALD